MSDAIPLVDVAATQAAVLEEVQPLVAEILATGAFMGGPHVAAFEAEYADFVQARHCVGVANGTDALEIALRAVGVGAGQRGRPAGQHLHRHRRGGGPDRREAGARRRRRATTC